MSIGLQVPPASETTDKEKLLKGKVALVGLILFFFGVLGIIVSFLTSGENREFLQELGFSVGSAGLVLALVEHVLRRESTDFVRVTIERTIDRHVQEMREKVGSVREGVGKDLEDALGKITGVVEVSKKRIDEALKQHSEETCTLVHVSIQGALDKELKDIRDAMAQEDVRKLLRATLSSREEMDLELADHLATIVEKLRELDTKGDWAKDVYRQYLAAVLVNVRDNVEVLCDSSAGRRSIVGGAVNLVSPAKRTDLILSQLMLKLTDGGGIYRVVSDFASWRGGQLSEFFETSLEVAKANVKIQRIFNFNLDSPNDIEQAEVGKILEQHLDASSSAVGYEVKLADRSSPMWIKTQHFGLFQRDNERDRCIYVEVEEVNKVDNRTLWFRNLPITSEEMRGFDNAWKALPDLTPELMKIALANWAKAPRD